MKKLYLPGTNKNVGYLNKDTMHLYERSLKYFPLSHCTNFSDLAVEVVPPVILTQKNKKIETNIQLKGHNGYIFDVNTKMWVFYRCTFKTPDNLDLVEMAHLYKNWKQKKNG